MRASLQWFQQVVRGWVAPFALLVLGLVGSIGCGSSGGGGGECTPGAPDCACIEGTRCADGAACVDGRCAASREVRLSVNNSSARACEVLLRDGAATVASVSFGDDVLGSFVREAPRTATSYSSREDVALPSVRVQVLGDGLPEVQQSECFDRDGRLLPDAEVVALGG